MRITLNIYQDNNKPLTKINAKGDIQTILDCLEAGRICLGDDSVNKQSVLKEQLKGKK